MLKRKNKPGDLGGTATNHNPPVEPEPQITVASNSQPKYFKISRSKNKKKDLVCGGYTCKDSRYEIFNKVSENGDSIYIPPFEELKGGKVYVSLDTTSYIEREELWKRLGLAFNRSEDD